MEKSLVSYLVHREKRLREEAALVENVNHNPVKGTHLEGLLMDFLKDELPKKFSVGSGFVIGLRTYQEEDSVVEVDRPVQSCEMDIVIYDEQNNTNPMRLLHKRDFFTESVYAVISVKKNLTSSELSGSPTSLVENIASARMAIPHHYSVGTGIGNSTFEVRGVMAPQDITGVGFAYGAKITLSRIKERLDGEKSKYGTNWHVKMPTLIGVLGQGIIYIDGSNGNEKYDIIHAPDNTLEEFFINLLGRIAKRDIKLGAGLRAYRKFYSAKQ